MAQNCPAPVANVLIQPERLALGDENTLSQFDTTKEKAPRNGGASQ